VKAENCAQMPAPPDRRADVARTDFFSRWICFRGSRVLHRTGWLRCDFQSGNWSHWPDLAEISLAITLFALNHWLRRRSANSIAIQSAEMTS
jgi:hypothetical protein